MSHQVFQANEDKDQISPNLRAWSEKALDKFNTSESFSEMNKDVFKEDGSRESKIRSPVIIEACFQNRLQTANTLKGREILEVFLTKEKILLVKLLQR